MVKMIIFLQNRWFQYKKRGSKRSPNASPCEKTIDIKEFWALKLENKVRYDIFIKLNNDSISEFLPCLVDSRHFLEVKFGFLVAFYPYICAFMKNFKKKQHMQKVEFFLCKAKKFRRRPDSNLRPYESMVRLLTTRPRFFTRYPLFYQFDASC